MWILRWNFPCWATCSFWHIVGNWTIFCLLQLLLCMHQRQFVYTTPIAYPFVEFSTHQYVPEDIPLHNSQGLSFWGISRLHGRFKWMYTWHQFMILMMFTQRFSHWCVYIIFLGIHLYLVDYNFYTLVRFETTVLHSSKRKHVNIGTAYSCQWTTLPSNQTDARCWMPYSYWRLRQM